MIERIDTPNGRFYRTPHGDFPSVTTVLSSIPNPSIEEWKNAVGPEVASKIIKKATDNGTRFHEYCEAYLKGSRPKLDVFDKQSWMGIERHLDLIEPLAIEKSLWSTKLKVAGTLDCLGKYKGKMCIIDFKTSSSDKYDGQFDSYWMQLAAYSVMVYERINLPIDELVIIMQSTSGETNVYYSNARKWIREFVKIRDAFEHKQTLLPR